ncbi:Glycerol-3-phosphate dehydrogenase [Halolactibacillus halophilus]|uniref:Aerobic glycerol-3-phosphate dehydrogenase n=1 Tax=Halolactibacillus halophilus TaxID=306540 RepID=A0A1I5PK39_9BACI|nr:FAD-dependent oxidoreductase [Halolactibacillus halophilus]GEM02045.1 aerobic glycerol-3-phosphate dehydrogenase [Halolactibacillus halophilus]SFP34217.1 Glycerol-3-phosphate dehydrogenase [Halolactibacillus halophilus]
MKLTNTNREETMRQLLETSYDVIVIGGGLTGASILFDLQMRGLKTLLIEKNDYASGASESFDLLVYDKNTYQTLPKQKKQELYQLNQNLGRAFQFLPAIELIAAEIPVTSEITKKLRPLFKKRAIDKPVASVKLSLTQKQQFEAVGTLIHTTVPVIDTARVTIDLIKASVALNADAINYVMVTDVNRLGDDLCSVFVEDQVTGEINVIHTKKVVNATGLDSPELHNRIQKKPLTLTPRKKYQWLVPKSELTINFPVIIKQGLYSYTVTLIPRDQGVLVSTVRPSGAILSTKAVLLEVKAEIERVLPEITLDINHVFTFKTTSEVDTDAEKTPFNFYRSSHNVLTVTGSSISNYRQYAEKIGDEVTKQFKSESAILYEQSNTKTRIVSADVLKEWTKPSKDEAKVLQLMNRYQIDQLHFERLSRDVYRLLDDYPIPRHLFIELLYTIEFEGVYKASDFIQRRLRLGVFDYSIQGPIILQIIRFMEYRLAWTKEERSYYEREVNQFMTERRLLGF